MGGLSPLGVGWLLQPIPTVIYPYFLIQTEVWVIGSPFGMLGRGMRVHQLLHQLSYGSPHSDLIANPPNQEVEGQRSAVPQLPNPADQRTATLPALTTVFPLVSQDQLGKPRPEGHPLRERLPFIVWVRLHLPTHYCVSPSSLVPTCVRTFPAVTSPSI